MSSTHEKRGFARTRVSFPVSIELANSKKVPAVAINIGKGGMLLNCDSGTSFSKLDDVNLYLPINHNKNSYTIAAKVTRVQGNNIGLFFYSDPSNYLNDMIT